MISRLERRGARRGWQLLVQEQQNLQQNWLEPAAVGRSCSQRRFEVGERRALGERNWMIPRAARRERSSRKHACVAGTAHILGRGVQEESIFGVKEEEHAAVVCVRKSAGRE